MKPLVLGILAHVDAGKTTLSEGLLYCTGQLKKLGRVDHKNAFLDTDALEKERGITIFSKQAKFKIQDWDITLLDTPGHVDFSGEMERTLQVLDYAILVINGAEGIQSHTQTVWKLLQEYRIPTFIFVNKMDLAQATPEQVLNHLREKLDSACFSFMQEPQSQWEEMALTEEQALEEFLQEGELCQDTIKRLILQRNIFPCYFGCALRLEGIERLIQGIGDFCKESSYSSEFGATVYKIFRDGQGNRLTCLKVTGGILKVKILVSGVTTKGEQWNQKIDQIRIYSGTKFIPVEQVQAGMVCAVTGLSHTMPGDGLGQQQNSRPPLLEPVLSCRLYLPENCDVHTALMKLSQLEEEEPQLHLVWNPKLEEIHLQMMGQVQLDILKRQILERYGLSVGFGAGKILYKETIADTVIGIGHFEPLRHYAEVHLKLEPLKRGSGLIFATECSEDILDKSWQNLALTHLQEKEHIGVLIGSPITDMKITLLIGKAHLKHTDGGDFREATYRAVRQGLMKANGILLEPWYQFRMELPQEQLGRAMTDIQKAGGEFDPPEIEKDTAILKGKVPASKMQDYPLELVNYTRGKGKIFCLPDGYRICHNTEQILEMENYNPERDIENTADSVFCSHGAGFTVHWSEVENYAHLESKLEKERIVSEQEYSPVIRIKQSSSSYEEEKELEAIFKRTYGESKRRELFRNQPVSQKEYVYQPQKPEYLLVDGYNIIFAWPDLKVLAERNMESARQVLADILCNYQGFKQCNVILVFDAYKVANGIRKQIEYNNIQIVYTGERETADALIEKISYQLKDKYRVRVATSDSAEQMTVLGYGALRLSAQMLWEEIERTNQEIRIIIQNKQ